MSPSKARLRTGTRMPCTLLVCSDMSPATCRGGTMEAQAAETPYGRYITSDGWFVHNLEEALAVRFEQGGALYPLEPREAPFRDLGVNVRVLWPGDAGALYHHEDAQEGFLVLSGECLLIVEEQERSLRRWDYFHCPPGTRHVIVGAGEGA